MLHQKSVFKDKINKRVFVFSSCQICCYNKTLNNMVFVCEKYYYVCRTNQINELEISKNYGKNTRFYKN